MKPLIVANPAVKVYKIEGRFGLGTFPLIEDVISNDETKKCKVLAFDMSGVTDVDSSALSFLIQILDRCGKIGIEMVLIDVPEPIVQLMRLARLDLFFKALPMKKFEQMYLE